MFPSLLLNLSITLHYFICIWPCRKINLAFNPKHAAADVIQRFSAVFPVSVRVLAISPRLCKICSGLCPGRCNCPSNPVVNTTDGRHNHNNDDIISSPRAAFLIYIITQPRAVIILSLDPKYIQSYLRPSPSVVKLVVVRSPCQALAEYNTSVNSVQMIS